jgi:hypothetical protein
VSPARAARAGVAVAVLGLAACATLRPTPPLVLIRGEDARVAEWLSRVRSDADARNALRADATVALETRERSGRFRQVILAARPARLRLETLNLLGQTQTLLVTDGREYAFFDGRELARGAVTPDVLRERLGIDLEPRDAVDALLVSPAVPEGAVPAAVWGRGEERIVDVDAARLRFAPQGDLAGVNALDADGHVRWSAAYRDWREARGGRYPFGVVLDFPATELRAELVVRDVEVNPPLDDALFRLPPGAGE